MKKDFYSKMAKLERKDQTQKLLNSIKVFDKSKFNQITGVSDIDILFDVDIENGDLLFIGCKNNIFREILTNSIMVQSKKTGRSTSVYPNPIKTDFIDEIILNNIAGFTDIDRKKIEDWNLNKIEIEKVRDCIFSIASNFNMTIEQDKSVRIKDIFTKEDLPFGNDFIIIDEHYLFEDNANMTRIDDVVLKLKDYSVDKKTVIIVLTEKANYIEHDKVISMQSHNCEIGFYSINPNSIGLQTARCYPNKKTFILEEYTESGQATDNEPKPIQK